MIRTYLEWVLELAWEKRSDDNLDLTHAREVLERDHAYWLVYPAKSLERPLVAALRDHLLAAAERDGRGRGTGAGFVLAEPGRCDST